MQARIEVPPHLSRRGPRLRFRLTPDGLEGGSPSWLGLPLAAVGLALLLLAGTGDERGQRRAVAAVVGTGFAMAGLVLGGVRHSFEISASRRTWRERKRILLWALGDRHGSLDDFAAVVLSEHRRPLATWPPRFWVLALARRDGETVIDLFVFFHHPRAEARLDALARLLALPAARPPLG